MHTFLLTPDMKLRSRAHSVLGIHTLQGKIVYVHTALEDIPREQITDDTGYPQHIIADFFSPDFSQHMQVRTSYNGKKVLFYTAAACCVENQRLFLNTLKYALYNPDLYDPLAMLYEITDSEIREVTPSPQPEKREHSDKKTYRFGDYSLRMASEWKLECRSAATDTLIWDMRLTAWLYSELEERNGILYFGTAGQGGHFYGVSLTDGCVIFDRNTGGTTAVVWVSDNLAITDRNGDLIFLNPADGSEIRRFHLKRMVISAGGLVYNGKFYTSAYDKKEFCKYAVCLQLSENENAGADAL